MRKIVSQVAAAALAAFIPAAAMAQGKPSDEKLLSNPPAGWQTYPADVKGATVTAMMLPPGATPDNWSEAISIQRTEGKGPSPKEFITAAVEQSKASCEGLQVGPPDARPINGYEAGSVRIACTKGVQSGKSGLKMVKAIRGKNALYVVQRMWKGAPVAANQALPVPQSVLNDWNFYEGTVVLCDAGDAKHPCPKAK
ncbi:MAG: hypothetical protein HY985_16805 [Magnetospirillum sp.]|nr:hypothetical protein [Magnetospirillum sp.]